MPPTSLTQPAIAEAAADAWEPGPLRPRLADGAVHVWRADLAGVSDDLVEVLSPEEHARANRFLKARDGRLWARAHGVLRVLLGRYLDADPVRLRFAQGEHGKPSLLDDSERAPAGRRCAAATQAGLSFNLSHSGGLALYAFSEDGEVGVDVEAAHRPIDAAAIAIAARVFGPTEAQHLKDLDPAIRRREFFRAWTRREAEVKRKGTGIGGHAEDSYGGRGALIVELNLSPVALAAVALSAPRRVQCWTW